MAVSDADGVLELITNGHSDTDSDWGATVAHDQEGEVTNVPAVDFSAFLKKLKDANIAGKKLMKMDIEGSEFTVVPKLMEEKLLCKGVVDEMTIEWHNWKASDMDTAENNMTIWAAEHGVSCPPLMQATTCIELDDESYLWDGMPLPSQEA